MPETRTPAFKFPFAPGRSCSDKRGTSNKAIKLKLLCFYTCIPTSYMLDDKIFCFIDSWGRHVQKNSTSRMRSWWWPLSIKTPVLGIERGRVSLPADLTCKRRLKNVLGSKNTTTTNCRLTHGTTRKSHTTITRHQEDKLSN